MHAGRYSFYFSAKAEPRVHENAQNAPGDRSFGSAGPPVPLEEHMWSIKATLMAIVTVLALTAVFTQPAAFGQSETETGSSAQDRLVKSEVETAISMLQAIYSKQQQGELTPEQAKRLGADLLRGLRYGTDGYFWADTTEGVNVVLYGRKDVEGKNRLAAKDVKGNFYVRSFIAKAKAGGGFLNYWFPKLNQTSSLPKRSYVQLFAPFGWVVGSGYYLPPNKTTTGKAH